LEKSHSTDIPFAYQKPAVSTPLHRQVREDWLGQSLHRHYPNTPGQKHFCIILLGLLCFSLILVLKAEKYNNCGYRRISNDIVVAAAKVLAVLLMLAVTISCPPCQFPRLFDNKETNIC
jgi:hypothetical protein